MIQTGIIRRTDLQFRAEYPEIRTIIYQISDVDHQIFCANHTGDFDDIVDHFERSIKPMTASVILTTQQPTIFSEIIPPILDTEIAKDFEGMGFTTSMFFNLLLSKFPTVRFQKIEFPSGERKAVIYTARSTEVKGNVTTHKFLSKGDRERITQFIDSMKMSINFEIVDEEFEEICDDFPQYEHEPIQVIHSAKLRKNREFDFSKRDEALYFDNLDKIYEGNFSKKDLYFFSPDSYSCYVDFTAFKNIDLRNHLLLFRTVYITLPYDKDIEKWLNDSKILKTEFLDLIARGRVKLILTQMETRYDVAFILEAYSANPDAVITRRALATLQQVDIVEISNNYLLNDQNLLAELVPICIEMGKQLNLDPKTCYEMLVWPLKARRKSFEPLLIKGVFSTAVFGINNAIEKQISLRTGHDLSYEFTVNASSIHLANALESTYFPFYEDGYSDQFYASVMGDLLNFYKSANVKNLKSFIDNHERVRNGVVPINPLDILDVNSFVPISELENEIRRNPTFQGGKLLMETLAQLTDSEREAKINFYNNEFVKNINGNKISADVVDLGTNAALDGIGLATGFPFVGSALSLIKAGGKAIRNAAISDKFSAKIENAITENPDKENIHYLTKINRVARIKRKF